MISPKAIITFAQYNEDLVLLALLHDVEKGFYVDVGANDPTIDSVTKLFYDKGWSGINIEPIKKLHKKLQKQRPRDINLQCGVGSKAGEAEFREYTGVSGHSTFDKGQKGQHDKSFAHEDYKVPVRTLKDILTEHGQRPLHFIKIDVEGFEHEVVAGNDWQKFRPEVICIEANHISTDWKTMLTKAGYRLFVSDGLNEYYVAEEKWSRTKDFADRMVKLDYQALKQHQYQSWLEDSKELRRLNDFIAKQDELIRTQTQSVNELSQEIDRLRELASLSLKNQPYSQRLKRAAHGLTTDWAQSKKQNKAKP